MAESPHLMIPFAAGPAAAGRAFVGPLSLPNLQRLLARLAPSDTIETPEDAPSMPHELALARALGLPDAPGRIPWAAHETRTIGAPCAFVTLCHWQVGMDRVQLLDPAALALTEGESRALLAAAAPWFADDGIALAHHAPGVWLASGEPFRDLATISLDRAVGRSVSRELLRSVNDGSVLTRLQNEVQMLFHDHPVADARMQRRQLHPNAIWVTGAGVLAQPAPAAPGVFMENRLRSASLQADPATSFEAIWREIDATSVAGLARQADSGADVRLTLAGERRAIAFAPHSGGLVARLAHRWKKSASAPAAILAQL